MKKFNALLVLLVLTANAQADDNDPECLAAWQKSSASRSCTGSDYIRNNNGICSMGVDCLTGGKQTEQYLNGDDYNAAVKKRTSGSWRVGDLEKLVNTNGVLTGAVQNTEPDPNYKAPAAPISSTACEDAWKKSSASGSCSKVGAFVLGESDGVSTCTLATSCTTGMGTQIKRNDIYRLDRVPNLSNNNGFLQVGY